MHAYLTLPLQVSMVLWRNAQQQMEVIGPRVAFQRLDTFRPAQDLSDLAAPASCRYFGTRITCYLQSHFTWA